MLASEASISSHPIHIGSSFSTLKTTWIFHPARQGMDAKLRSTLTDQDLSYYESISHFRRRLEWCEARRCERLLRQQLGPTTAVSISHTQHKGLSWVAAVGANNRQPTISSSLSIGIDCEPLDRQPSPLVCRQLILADEDKWKLDPLSTWVIKEACFKAHKQNKHTVTWAYQVVNWDPNRHIGQVLPPNAKTPIDFHVFTHDDFLLAIALAT